MWLAQSGRIGRLWRRSQFTTDEGSRDPAFAQAHARAGFSFLANEALGTTPCDLLIPAASSCGRLPCRLARRLISVHGIAPPRIVMQRLADAQLRAGPMSLIGKPRLDLRVGKRGVDLSVKLANDLSRRVLRSAEAEPATKAKGRRTASFSSAPLSLPWVSPHAEGQPSPKLRT
jgi:hypothetical protein